MIGAIAEFEGANLLERQREGITIAKAIRAGKRFKDLITGMKYIQGGNREVTGKEAMELMGLKRNTFYKLVKEYESLENK